MIAAMMGSGSSFSDFLEHRGKAPGLQFIDPDSGGGHKEASVTSQQSRVSLSEPQFPHM